MSTAKKPPVWGKKDGKGHSVRLLLAKPYLGVRQELQPAFFILPGELIKRRPGHQERAARRSWLALTSEFSLTVMRNRQAGRVPELSNLCKRKSHLSLAAPPGNAGGLFGVILILFTVWHMQSTICLHGSSQHF